MAAFDLKSIHLGETNIAKFALKRDAIAFARAHGWPSKKVHEAFNRFNIFWIVSDVIGAETLRILTKDGGWIDLPA